jgi:hypothetical protein
MRNASKLYLGLLLIGSCLFGCRQTSETSETPNVAETGEPFATEAVSTVAFEDPWNGVVERGVAFQGTGVSTGSIPLYFSDWEEPFSLVCQKADCEHKRYNELRNPEPVCGSVYPDSNGIGTFLYGDRRYELCVQSLGTNCYETMIYCGDENGENLEFVTALEGRISSSAMVLRDGVLYGTLENQGKEQEEEKDHFYVYYPLTMFALDLETYSVSTYEAGQMRRNGFDELYVSEDYVFARNYEGFQDCTTLYVVRRDSMEGSAYLENQAGEGHQFGAISNQIFYTTGDSSVNGYDADRGVVTRIGESGGMDCASACVTGERLAVCSVEDVNIIYRFYTAPGVYDEELNYGQTDLRLYQRVGAWMLLKTRDGQQYRYAPYENPQGYVEDAVYLCYTGGTNKNTGEDGQ